MNIFTETKSTVYVVSPGLKKLGFGEKFLGFMFFNVFKKFFLGF